MSEEIRNKSIWISKNFGLTENAFLCCESFWGLVRIFILGFWCPYFKKIFDLDFSFLMRGKAVFQCSYCFQLILIGKFVTWWCWWSVRVYLCRIFFIPNFITHLCFVALWFPLLVFIHERWSIQHEILGNIYLKLQWKCSSHNHNKNLDFSHLLQ